MHDNPHDAFFKLVFADPEHAAGELRSILPPEIAAKHPHAKRLPVILPIVLHHSEAGWRAATSFEEVLDVAPGLRGAVEPFVPRFRFLLDDVSHATDADLRRRAMSALGKLALACLRDVRRPAVLLAGLVRWADLFAEVRAAPNGPGAVAAVLKYIAAACRRLPEEEIGRLMAQLTTSQSEDTEGTLGDQLREYFREDGIAHGRREMLLLQLRERFGELPESAVSRVRRAGGQELEAWAVRVLRAATLEEVWAEG